MVEETNQEQSKANGGQFAPGTSGNPKGRPPGKKADLAKNTTDFMDWFLHKNMRRTVERNFKKLTEKQQMDFLVQLAKLRGTTKIENTNSGEITFKFEFDDENGIDETLKAED